MNKLKLILLSLCLMMVACDANDSISRENRCQFIFDTTLHPLPCHLTGIIGNNGHFCQVQTYVDNQGIRHLKTTRNYDNAKDDVALTTARESQFNYYLGANDCIIIGTSSFDWPVSQLSLRIRGLQLSSHLAGQRSSTALCKMQSHL